MNMQKQDIKIWTIFLNMLYIPRHETKKCQQHQKTQVRANNIWEPESIHQLHRSPFNETHVRLFYFCFLFSPRNEGRPGVGMIPASANRDAPVWTKVGCWQSFRQERVAPWSRLSNTTWRGGLVEWAEFVWLVKGLGGWVRMVAWQEVKVTHFIDPPLLILSLTKLDSLGRAYGQGGFSLALIAQGVGYRLRATHKGYIGVAKHPQNTNIITSYGN